ncbi:MAG: LPS export ABC transporter ATP-binding protein [bacterium]|nr:LPS export ABC transporter ATP-binding protein [bacterium]
MLEVRGISKKFGSRFVVNNVHIEASLGKITGLIGPNGAGKTTTFYMIVGFLKPDSGSIFFDATDITELEIYKRALKGLIYLSQEPSIFRKLTVEENLYIIGEMHYNDKAMLKNRIDQLLKEFGIEKTRKTPAGMISGGEKRRLEIARTLLLNPKMLLMDEPFVGIDPITIGELKELIKKLKNSGVGFLISDHNIHALLSIADYIYVIHNGSVISKGAPEEIKKDEKVKSVYFGNEIT